MRVCGACVLGCVCGRWWVGLGGVGGGRGLATAAACCVGNNCEGAPENINIIISAGTREEGQT